MPKRTEERKQQFAAAYDINTEIPFKGMEALIAQEMPADRLWSFLESLRDGAESEHIPAARPTDEAGVRKLAFDALRSSKGAGWAARLFEECAFDELPKSVMDFLYNVWEAMPKLPEEAPEDDPAQPATA